MRDAHLSGESTESAGDDTLDQSGEITNRFGQQRVLGGESLGLAAGKDSELNASVERARRVAAEGRAKTSCKIG